MLLTHTFFSKRLNIFVFSLKNDGKSIPCRSNLFSLGRYEDKVRELDIPENATVLNDGSSLYELYGKRAGRNIQKLEVKNNVEVRIPCLNINSINTGIVGIKKPDLIYLADKRVFVEKSKLENSAFKTWTVPKLVDEAESNLERII